MAGVVKKQLAEVDQKKEEETQEAQGKEDEDEGIGKKKEEMEVEEAIEGIAGKDAAMGWWDPAWEEEWGKESEVATGGGE